MLISKFENINVEDKLSEMIRIYGLAISQDYRNFLLKYNGGETPDTEINTRCVKTDVEGFFGFTEKNKYFNFSFVLSNGYGEQLIKDKKLPIATNAFGDYIILDCSEKSKTKGEIFFTFHDRPKNFHKLASNFMDLIKLCKSKKIGHISTIEERKRRMIDEGLGDKISEVLIADWQREIDKYGHIVQEKVIF